MTGEPAPFTSLARDARGVAATVDPAWAARASAGHFPGDPLLPGSAILELMARAAAPLLDAPARLAAVEHAVFRVRVDPARPVVVRAAPLGAHRVEARLYADGAEAAFGRLRFEPAA